MLQPQYLDFNATTPTDPRVFEAMRPYFLEDIGNAGSRTHVYGQRAKEAVDIARDHVASLLGARSDEIIFTSGATESNNAVIAGLSQHAVAAGKRHIIATAIEHKAVLEPLEILRERGFSIEVLPVTPGGFIEPEAVKNALRADTLLVSVMHANNETGVLQPVEAIGDLLAETGVFFHVDAAQTYGKEVDRCKSLRCDFLSISGHKIYGPKGIGALFARRPSGQKRPLVPLFYGGGQEMGLRPGTIPVPLVVGLGEAAALASKEYQTRRQTAMQVKQRLLAELDGLAYTVNGDTDRCQTHVLNLSFHNTDSEALMMAVRNELAFSNGAACTSASYEPSHVLLAMGLSEDRIAEAIRLSWGPGIDSVNAEPLVRAVRRLAS
jgi:cysteine desulfurase